jgi:hypothetical protein
MVEVEIEHQIKFLSNRHNYQQRKPPALVPQFFQPIHKGFLLQELFRNSEQLYSTQPPPLLNYYFTGVFSLGGSSYGLHAFQVFEKCGILAVSIAATGAAEFLLSTISVLASNICVFTHLFAATCF